MRRAKHFLAFPGYSNALVNEAGPETVRAMLTNKGGKKPVAYQLPLFS